MEGKIVDYRILVVGATSGGHPVQRITRSLPDASSILDTLTAENPDKEVRLYETVEILVKVNKPKAKPIPKSCPRGHLEETDEKSVIVKTDAGYYCNVCGDFFIPIC